MTIEQKLQNEIDALTAKRAADKAANSVECDWPKTNRSWTRRTSPAIKASDLAL